MTDHSPTPSTARVTLYVDYLGDEPEAPPPRPGRKKMTKAERMELERQEEVAFRKLEMTETLKREVGLAKKSVKRGKLLWLHLCRQIKLDELREEFKFWEEEAYRVLKEKDERIEYLLHTIATAKKMHRRAFEMHLQTLDYLKDVFPAFQNKLQSDYETQCQEMLHDFYNNICELSGIEEAHKQKFQNILNDNNASLENQVFADFHKFMEEREDAVNTEIIKRYRIRDSTKKTLNSLHNQLLEFVDALRQTSTDDLKYDKVNHLMKRHKKFVTDFKKLNENEINKSRTLQKLQKELAQIEDDDKRTINSFNLEHAYIRDKHRGVEHRMEQNRKYIHQKLTVLTTECYGISKSLAKLTKHANLLGALSANCKKLQTQSEKVTLLGDFQEPMQAQQIEELKEFKLKIIDLKSHIDLSDEELLAQMQLMKHFWRRQALAEAQTVLLEKQKRELLIENQRYMDKIKSLGKADNVADLQKALKVKCILKKKPFI